MSLDSSSSLAPSQRRPSRRFRITVGVIVLVVSLAVVSIVGSRAGGATASGGTVLVLALPAFLAGMLSFLSPCCLPVLSAYFALTVQTQRERMLGMSVAFFLGLATTLVALGATATALSQILFRNLNTLTLVGGLLVITFGVMSVLGKGFGGVTLVERPGAGVAGAYVYGATFALGWTACVGPILGALLAMLATQGIAVLEGAALAFIYALGLGVPIMALTGVVRGVDKNGRFWRVLRGRGFSVNLGFTTIHTHTTSILSGGLLIVVGLLLATGQLAMFSRWAVQSPLAQWVLSIEEGMRQFLLGG